MQWAWEGGLKSNFHIIQNIIWGIVQMVHMAPWGPMGGPHSFSN